MRIIDNLIETGNFRGDKNAPYGCGCAISVCGGAVILIAILLLAGCNNPKQMAANKQSKEIKTEKNPCELTHMDSLMFLWADGVTDCIKHLDSIDRAAKLYNDSLKNAGFFDKNTQKHR